MDDLRTRRTRKIIRDAFLELLSEMTFEEMTVNDISQKALINRTTFYRHYEDKYSLLMDIFRDSMQSMMSAIGSVEDNLAVFSNQLENTDPSDQQVRDKIRTLTEFYEYFKQNRKIFQSLLGINGSLWFTSEMNKYLENYWKDRLKTVDGRLSMPRPDALLTVEVAAVWLARSTVSILGWWLEKGETISPEMMAKITLSIIVQGYYKTLRLTNQPSEGWI
jgi:AcrR family transcriptional regulator